jgi:phosphoglycerol transferase
VGTYLNGSDVEIFSIGDFMRSHGYGKVVGLKSRRDEHKVPGQNSWGVPDATLFAEAKAELARLASGKKPFFLSLLTASTHGPNGYPEPGFSYTPPVLPAVKDSFLPAAIRCTIDQTLDFVDEVERLGIANKTVIVITNDHLAMPNTLWKELRQIEDRRAGLLVIKGGTSAPAGAVCDRPATHLDTFPTILEAMGYRLRDGRANLGVSLLSGQPTLAETLGYKMLDRALAANKDIKSKVWQDLSTKDRQTR